MLQWGNFFRESFWATKYRQSWSGYTYYEIGYPLGRKSKAKKVEFKIIVQICTNCGILSNRNNLFLISSGIVMSASFLFIYLFTFCTTIFNPRHYFQSDIFCRDFQQGIILPSYIISGVQLKRCCRKRI